MYTHTINEKSEKKRIRKKCTHLLESVNPLSEFLFLSEKCLVHVHHYTLPSSVVIPILIECLLSTRMIMQQFYKLYENILITHCKYKSPLTYTSLTSPSCCIISELYFFLFAIDDL